MKSATVILFFNKPAMTLRCVRSVAAAVLQAARTASGAPGGWKIICVDNGSTAVSSEQIRVGAEAAVAGIAEIEWVRLDNNQGFGVGMNAGLARAFADSALDLVWTLSNDIELPENFYTLGEVEKVISTKEPRIFAPQVYHLMDRSRIAYTYGEIDVETLQLNHRVSVTPGDHLNEICFPQYFPAAAQGWTRAAFEATGGFNEKYFCTWEDVDLSWRCSQLGVKIQSLPERRVYHLGRGTIGSKSLTSTHFANGRSTFAATLRCHADSRTRLQG